MFDSLQYACPECHSRDHINISAHIWVRIVPDGSETWGDHEWDDDSPSYCGNCNWSGQVRELIDVNP